jgi:hypothetical protein
MASSDHYLPYNLLAVTMVNLPAVTIPTVNLPAVTIPTVNLHLSPDNNHYPHGPP